ncbi:MAG: 16S rRNA (uracil(1498)-N(3))-methyltransferase [Burkholderiaceae bacterium]
MSETPAPSAAPRFHCPAPLQIGATVALSAGAARHVQVLRLQPGDGITLFGGMEPDGSASSEGSCSGEFSATITAMGRRDVQAMVVAYHVIDREAAHEVQLAIGVPANDRMDWLVEKATELGVAAIVPLMTARSVLRLDGERVRKKAAHWSSIAIAACEQCGRNRVPTIVEMTSFADWVRQMHRTDGTGESRLVLSLRSGSRPLRETVAAGRATRQRYVLLSGPEGGLDSSEEGAALQLGFEPVSLGKRVLRAETAALAALTLLA